MHTKCSFVCRDNPSHPSQQSHWCVSPMTPVAGGWRSSQLVGFWQTDHVCVILQSMALTTDWLDCAICKRRSISATNIMGGAFRVSVRMCVRRVLISFRSLLHAITHCKGHKSFYLMVKLMLLTMQSTPIQTSNRMNKNLKTRMTA